MPTYIKKVQRFIFTKRFKVCSKIIVSLLLIVLFIQSFDLSGLWAQLIDVDLFIYSIAMLFVVLGVFLSVYKWSILLRSLGICRPYIQLVHIYYIGTFFNMFMPGSVGGDIVRLELFRKQTGRLMRGGISILAERFMGLLALWSIASVSFLFNYELFNSLAIKPLLIITMLFTFIIHLSILFSSVTLKALYWIELTMGKYRLFKISSVFRKVLLIVDVLMTNKRSMVMVFTISLLFQTLTILTKILIAFALSVDIDWRLFFLLSPITATLIMLPISFQGIGVREWSYVVLFGMVGVATKDILSVSVVVFSLVIINSLIGGIIYNLPVCAQKLEGLENHISP